MTDLSNLLHPAEMARLRYRMHFGHSTTNMLTFAVVCSLTTATVIVVAALAGSL